VLEAEAADQSAVIERAVSLVKSTVTAAGVICEAADPIIEIPGAAVADPTAGVVRPDPSFAEPIQNIVPESPLDLVCKTASCSQIALVMVDPPVIVVDCANTVPDTPPQRIANTNVGVAVVLYLPAVYILIALPSDIKLPGIVIFGKIIVSVVVLATAVPSATTVDPNSAQY